MGYQGYGVPSSLCGIRQGDIVEFYEYVGEDANGESLTVTVSGRVFGDQPGDVEMISPQQVGPLAIPYSSGRYLSWKARVMRPVAVYFSVSVSGVGVVSGTPVYGTVLYGTGANAEAALQVTGSAPARVREGEKLTVSFTVSNFGEYKATDIVGRITTAGTGSVGILSAGPRGLSALASGKCTAISWDLEATKAGTLSVYLTVTGRGNCDRLGDVLASVGFAIDALNRPVYDSESLVYPNPVTGDRMRVGVALANDASELEVEVYNSGFQRVFRGVWREVGAAEGGVDIDGILKWAPGVYLIKVRAKYAVGGTQDFKTVKAVVKR